LPSILAEGETSNVAVARFGGGSEPSTITVETTSLTKLYEGFNRKTGVAGRKDYATVKQTGTIRQDFDAPDGHALFMASTELVKDSVVEADGEVFAWSLTTSDTGRQDRLFSIMDRSRRYGLLDAPDENTIQAFFNGLGSWFRGLVQQLTTQQPPSTGDLLAKKLARKQPVKLPGSDSSLIPRALVPMDKGGLIGVDGGSLIGVDGGSLIGVDGGTLIGVDGGSLIGIDGGSLIGIDGGSLIGVDGGTFNLTGTVVSGAALGSLANLQTALGTPLIAAGDLM
jgi:hypothetical protein